MNPYTSDTRAKQDIKRGTKYNGTIMKIRAMIWPVMDDNFKRRLRLLYTNLDLRIKFFIRWF